MAIEINEFEAKLLYFLDTDSRQSSTQLAKKLRTSPQRIEYTVDKLEKEGVIIRYSVVVNYSKLGSYTYYGYFVKFVTMNKKEREETFQKISENKKCAFFYETEGEWEALIGTMARDIYQAEKNLNELFGKIENKIKKKDLVIFTRVHNQKRTYLFNLIKEKNKEKLLEETIKKSLEIVGDAGKLEKFDQKDLEILDILGDNGKMKIVEIAKKIKMKPETVWYRIKNLEKNGIISRYTIVLQPSSYKHLFYLFDIKTKTLTKEEKTNVVLFLKKFDNTWRIIELLEKERIFLLLMCSKEEEKNWIIEKIKEEFTTKIDEITVNRIIHLYSFRFYIPDL